ncbi:MAG: hypothetical protein Q9N34_00530 [Aquificota bacterium]|nr:hypothetical protein [Aquificota bacterium]
MEQIEEFTFPINSFMAHIESASDEEINSLRKWLGRNEKRFMCILEYHFNFDEYSHLIEDCEKDRCMVNWLKVYKYINILGIQIDMTVYPVILWDVPLGGSHRITYNAQFRYKKRMDFKKGNNSPQRGGSCGNISLVDFRGRENFSVKRSKMRS